ncbi:MAG: hypothetical protein IJR88_00435 [Clostridia bacterium]|nr:hypothetical protein [Clostridia bacterium]
MAVKIRRNSHYRNCGALATAQVGMLVGLRPKIVSRAVGSLSDRDTAGYLFSARFLGEGAFLFLLKSKETRIFYHEKDSKNSVA